MTTQSLETKRELTTVKRSSGVALIMFDSASKFNSLGSSTIQELNSILDVIEKDDSIKAVIGISGKHDSFIIGADLYEIRKTESKEELLRLSRTGQALLNRISTYNKPFVIAINGACLGGGLEIALSCHWRVATTSEKTILGLPETRLGLIPGIGGTQRLPRLIGLKVALDMILSASTVSSQQAKELGLIDELVESDDLIAKAEQKALALIDAPEWKSLVQKNQEELQTPVTDVKATPFCLTDLTPEKADKMLAISERAVKLRSKGHYPAQPEAIKAIRAGLQKGLVEGLRVESESFAELAAGEVSANLISLVFNSDLAKASAQALIKKFPDSEVNTIGIIGAGNMGCSLAELAAANGIKSIVKTDISKIESVKEKIEELARRGALHKAGKHDAESKQEALDLILSKVQVVSELKELAKADLIIECVAEQYDIKAEKLNELSSAANEKCIIATNTSALSVTELSQSVSKPENFLGVHFFHPVDRMPLVELIAQPSTSKAALAKASNFILKLDKTSLNVKDKPGFLINRLLTVYLFEFARLAEELTPVNWAEDALLEFGMPMGPMQLMDEIGIDVAFTVAKNLEEGLGHRMQSPEIFKRVCAIGMSGKKGNVGFYLWENNEKKLGINPDMLEKTGAVISEEKPNAAEKERIMNRMVFAMLDEAARCLEEKVVARPRDIDFALILGVGFPAFRGGLLKYADQLGLSNVVHKLEGFYAQSFAANSAAERTVCPLLKRYATEGRGFYSLAGAKEEQ